MSFFSHASSNEENFILIGDSGKLNQGQKTVSESLNDYCKNNVCQYGLLAGDNVYPSGVKSKKDKILYKVFDDFYNSLGIPFFVALGNHDYGRLSISPRKASYQLLHARKNPLFILPYYWHLKETNNAVIATIDTTRLMWGKNYKDQAEFLDHAYHLSLIKNKWFIVQGHHPFLSNGTHGNAGNYENYKHPYFLSGKYVKKFIQNYVCGKAHFYISGHDHSLQVIDGKIKNCDTIQIVSGSAAEVTKLYPRNQTKFEALELGFFHLTIEKNSLKIKAINTNQEILFEEDYLKIDDSWATKMTKL